MQLHDWPYRHCASECLLAIDFRMQGQTFVVRIDDSTARSSPTLGSVFNSIDRFLHFA